MYVSGFENTVLSGVLFCYSTFFSCMLVQRHPFSLLIFHWKFNLTLERIAASLKPCKLSKMSERWLRECLCQFVTF